MGSCLSTSTPPVVNEAPKKVLNGLLPPKREEHRHMKCLVLDLDETLIHSSPAEMLGNDDEDLYEVEGLYKEFSNLKVLFGSSKPRPKIQIIAASSGLQKCYLSFKNSRRRVFRSMGAAGSYLTHHEMCEKLKALHSIFENEQGIIDPYTGHDIHKLYSRMFAAGGPLIEYFVKKYLMAFCVLNPEKLVEVFLTPESCREVRGERRNSECGFHTRERPHAREFLKEVSKHFEVVVWTAAKAPYANTVLDDLDEDRVISYRLYRDSCLRNCGYIKDLSLLGRNLKDVIIIDDTPMSYSLQVENAILMEGWLNDPKDTKLKDLIPVLTTTLKHAIDVRDLLDPKKSVDWLINQACMEVEEESCSSVPSTDAKMAYLY